jgi:hemin uptake protein HemP
MSEIKTPKPVTGQPPSPSPLAPPPLALLRVTSQQLFAGAVEVRIDHFGAIYRLKQTALGKLILTK